MSNKSGSSALLSSLGKNKKTEELELFNVEKKREVKVEENLNDQEKRQVGRPRKNGTSIKKSINLSQEVAELMDEIRFEYRYKFESDLIEEAIKVFYEFKKSGK